MRLLAPLLALLLVACNPGPQWTGWVYPNGEDFTRHIELGRFDTFEKCQSAAVGALRTLPDPESGAYECGRKCRFDKDMNINVCAETRD